MFDGLKKKFSSFIDSITKKEEEKVKEEAAKIEAQPEPQKQEVVQQKEPEPEKVVEPPTPVHHEIKKAHGATVVHETTKMEERPVHIQKQPENKPIHVEKPQEQAPVHIEKTVENKPVHIERPQENKPVYVEKTQEQKPVYTERPMVHVDTRKVVEQPKPAPKISFGTKLKGFVFREVKISDKDVEPFLEELKISLIQSDVNYDVVERILERIHKELVASPIGSNNISANITKIIRHSIFETLNKKSSVDIVKLVNEKKSRAETPFRILFIGPNGAGKTTAMAKIANMMIKNNLTCVMSASDTFRAAAIEQTVYHASKLGIAVIKGKYGADPASVAFDAIAHAKAHKIDVVLIDSAGRQETNKSLMEEIKKMVRIAQPDMKIFVGESIVGNALLNQVREFDQAVKLDGIILTKLDADAKGGNTLSILSDTEVPILFFGTGEKYDDLMSYDPEFVVDNIIPQNN